MAITKRLEYKEEILPNQVIQIRTTTHPYPLSEGFSGSVPEGIFGGGYAQPVSISMISMQF